MKFLSFLSPLALTFILVSPHAEAGGNGLSAHYRNSPSGGHLGVHIQVGNRGPRYTGSSAYYRRSGARSGAPTWTRGAPRSRRVWIPGHYEVVQRKTWVPGATRQVWVPPVYETRYDWCGRAYTVLVSAGYHRTIQDPGHWEYRNVQVWQEPHFEVRR
jgi:hypothetical protein